MLRATLLVFSVSAWISNALEASSSMEVMGTPWWNAGDPIWFVSRAAERTNLLQYTISLQSMQLSSLAQMDKLPLQNGSATYAAVLSSDRVGVSAGFPAADLEPISMARLSRRIQENRQRNIVPVSACGYEETDGRILFESMWMPSKTTEYQVQFDNENQTMTNFLNQGYSIVSACSTKMFSNRAATPSVVIVWHRRRTQASTTRLEQRIFVNVTEANCSSTYLRNAKEQFFPISMQLFNKGNDVRCTAIWQKFSAPSLKYELRTGSAPADVVNLDAKQMKPRQVSVYRDMAGREQLMVLWTNYDTRNISFDGSIYNETDNIPINWLPGSTTGMKEEDKAYFESRVTKVMRAGQIPALTFALSRNEQLKRAVAFGYANPFTEAATVATKFRTGSISKMFTAAAIFSLIDQGLLSLNATVFGPGSILGTEYGTKPYSEKLLKVRLVNLLEHSSGGWGAQTTGDALFLYEGYNQSAFIGIEIDKYGPVVEPGTMFDYANFGYYLLGVIISKVTGKPYDQYVKEKFWRPAGIPEDRVGIEKRWLSERQPNEAMFFPNAYQRLTDSYDLIDPERMASAGGWIASPSDVLRVTRLFNGFNATKDVLTSDSSAEMCRPSKASGGTYCRGVAVGTDFLGVWHNGIYSGSGAMYERHNNGIELMYMHNKGPDASTTTEAIEGVGRMFIDLTPNWPQHDLFST
uniref:Beta-lactamase-related domain-containing protein n=1 Tax=Plectus sambesii TaxID=2011161 RepID=A0A914WHQ0_9BILA